MIIKIADLFVEWNFDDSGFMDNFVVDDKEINPVIKISHNKKMNICHGIQYVGTPTDHILGHYGPSVEFLGSNSDWSDVTIYCENYSDVDYSLPLAAICSRFAEFNTVFLHGSFVEYEGSGVVFAGYSGVGKTTQAVLWNEFTNADIINGDKVFLRVSDNEVYAYGSPWKGSSEYCLNKKTPLKGVVVLKQSPENKIKKLSTIECIELFMPHVFLPHWDENNMLKAIDTFNLILEKTPVWLLECRPDEDAVKLTRDTIFNTKN